MNLSGRFKTNIMKLFFIQLTVQQWNSLSQDARHTKSQVRFKNWRELPQGLLNTKMLPLIWEVPYSLMAGSGGGLLGKKHFVLLCSFSFP